MKRDARIGLSVILVLGLSITLLVARALHKRAQTIQHAYEAHQMERPIGHEEAASAFAANDDPFNLGLGDEPGEEYTTQELDSPAAREQEQALRSFLDEHPFQLSPPTGTPDLPMAETVELPDEYGMSETAVAQRAQPVRQAHQGPVGASATARAPAAPVAQAPLALPPLGYTTNEVPDDGTARPITAAAPARASAEPVVGRTYTVQSGDNPWKIADKLFGKGHYASKLMDANPGVDPTRLKVGQELKVPNLDTPAAAPSPVTASTSVPVAAPVAEAAPAGLPGEQTYTIQPGDTLAAIARQFYGTGGPKSVTRLVDANPGIDPRRLAVGKVIKVPAN